MPPVRRERFGGGDHVCDLAPWLTPLGFRDQHATWVSEPLHEAQRQAWCHTTWPPMLPRAQANRAWRWCGDAASFPPWGTPRRPLGTARPPTGGPDVGTCQGATVCGGLDDCPGRCFSQGHEGRLHSASDRALLPRVGEQTTPHLLRMHEGASDHTAAARPACGAHHTARLQGFNGPALRRMTIRERSGRRKSSKQAHLCMTSQPLKRSREGRADAMAVCASTRRDSGVVPSADGIGQGRVKVLTQKIFFLKAISSQQPGDFHGTWAAIPAEPSDPVITVSAALAFRKHRCENTP